MAGRAGADGRAGGGMTRPAKAANGCLPWMLAGGHQALLPRISPLGTPIYSLWSNRANLWHVDVYQKYNHFVNFSIGMLSKCQKTLNFASELRNKGISVQGNKDKDNICICI